MKWIFQRKYLHETCVRIHSHTHDECGIQISHHPTLISSFDGTQDQMTPIITHVGPSILDGLIIRIVEDGIWGQGQEFGVVQGCRKGCQRQVVGGQGQGQGFGQQVQQSFSSCDVQVPNQLLNLWQWHQQQQQPHSQLLILHYSLGQLKWIAAQRQCYQVMGQWHWEAEVGRVNCLNYYCQMQCYCHQLFVSLDLMMYLDRQLDEGSLHYHHWGLFQQHRHGWLQSYFQLRAMGQWFCYQGQQRGHPPWAEPKPLPSQGLPSRRYFTSLTSLLQHVFHHFIYPIQLLIHPSNNNRRYFLQMYFHLHLLLLLTLSSGQQIDIAHPIDDPLSQTSNSSKERSLEQSSTMSHSQGKQKALIATGIVGGLVAAAAGGVALGYALHKHAKPSQWSAQNKEAYRRSADEVRFNEEVERRIQDLKIKEKKANRLKFVEKRITVQDMQQLMKSQKKDNSNASSKDNNNKGGKRHFWNKSKRNKNQEELGDKSTHNYQKEEGNNHSNRGKNYYGRNPNRLEAILG